MFSFIGYYKILTIVLCAIRITDCIWMQLFVTVISTMQSWTFVPGAPLTSPSGESSVEGQARLSLGAHSGDACRSE